jgi:hypothetical protein
MSPDPGEARRLELGYYLVNFERVLAAVELRYRDLLAAEEIAFIDDFRALDLPARRVYVRLLGRRGPLFRSGELDYPEVPEMGAALAELEAGGFLDRAPEADAAALLALLRKPELARLSAELGAVPARSARRAALLSLIVNAGVDPGALRERCGAVRLRRGEHIEVFRLLYFGGERRDLQDFVLRDLGVLRYEPYPIEASMRLFGSRAELDTHRALLRCEADVSQALAAEQLDAALELSCVWPERAASLPPRARRRADRILSSLGRACERAGRFESALELYEAAWAAPARERRARVLASLNRGAEALEICSEIAAQPRDESERDFVSIFEPRLRRRLGQRLPAPRRHRPRVRSITLTRALGMSVEEQALEALAAEGRSGFFAENRLWRSLFGLVCWEQVFSAQPGAFQHPFQGGPLDLEDPSFLERRRALFEARFRWLRKGAPGLERELLERVRVKRGVVSELVSWSCESEQLREVVGRVPGRHLALIFERLGRDIGRNGRGFPDLFVSSEGRGGYELIEVKGPGDQLRAEQRSWLRFFEGAEIPSSVLKVCWR